MGKEWQRADKKIKTIFYQGLYNSQVQASKYIVPGFIGTTGEYIRCEKALDLIHDVYIGEEIGEITPMNSWMELLNPIKLYNYICTGLSNWYYDISITRSNEAKELSSSTLICHHINYFALNFGQEGDVTDHYNKYINFLRDYPDHDYIMWGVSKGAATTINAIATNKYDISKLKMIVLEGCYDSIENVFSSWGSDTAPIDCQRDINSNSWLGYLMLMILPYLPIQYRSNPYWDPINRVGELPDVPILLITSKADKLVPAYLTKRLFNKLQDTGHNHVYLLELAHSAHPRYMFDDEQDRGSYFKFVHGLYNKYCLPSLYTLFTL